MNSARMVGTYALLFIALIGCFWLIGFSRGDEAQAWPVILLIIGALVRDAASIQSAQSSKDITAAANSNQPTITTSAGPPATTTVTPPDPDPPRPFRDAS
jgi:hypothetical protein